MACECGGGCVCCQESSPSCNRSRTADCKHSDDVLPLSDASGDSLDLLLVSHLNCIECWDSDNPADEVREEEESGDQSGPFPSFDLNSVVKKAFVKMVVATKMSIACIGSFQEFSSCLVSPLVKPLSRKVVQEEIVHLYKEELATVKEELAMVTGRISLRIGIWADDWEMNSNYEFICINSRWIDDDWAVQERLLEFRAFIRPYYLEDMNQWLSYWQIDRKLLGMSFDDESHKSPELVNSLKGCLVSDGYKASFLNIQCCEHLLNSIVLSFLKCIKPIVEKVRDGISCISGWGRNQKEFYKLAQTSYQVDVNKKLILELPGRWNSTYIMLDRALLYKEALLDWGRRDEKYKKFSLRNDEWEKVAVLTKLLKSFYDVISSFSRTMYPTSNIYLSGIYLIYRHLLGENQQSDYAFMRCVMNDALEKLRKYCLDNSLVLTCAAILDPHCKVAFVESCYRELLRSDESIAKEYVNQNLASLHTLFDEYKEKFSHLSSRENELHPLKSELDLYLEDELISEEIDILEYWKNNARTNRYPVLAMLTRDILAVPVSVLGSEGCFYTGKKVTELSGRRRTYENLQVRICLADWCCAHTPNPEGGRSRGPELLAIEPFQEVEDDEDVAEEFEDDYDEDDDDDYDEDEEDDDEDDDTAG